MRWVLRSKLHRATVTAADPEHAGSLTLDEELIERAGFCDGEKVLVASVTSGARLGSNQLAGARGEGPVVMNGPAARLIHPDEIVVIMGFELSERRITPRVVLVDQANGFAGYKQAVDDDVPVCPQ